MTADHRILADEEKPADEAVADRQHHWLLRMIAGDLRNPLIAPLVVGPRVIAVPRPQETHRVLRKVRPPPGPRVLRLQVVVERSVLLVRLRLRQIAGQEVVEGRNVGRALDARVAA